MTRQPELDDERAPRLYLCPDCRKYARVQEPSCPFCGSTARADVSGPEWAAPMYGGAPIELPPIVVRPEQLPPDASVAPPDVEGIATNIAIPDHDGWRSVWVYFALVGVSVFFMLWWTYAAP